MKTLTLNQSIKVLAATAVLLAATAIQAQTDQTFIQALHLNAQKLKEYTWKSRTEIQKGGQRKSVQLALMRYDSQGKLQTTPLSGTQEQVPELGLRGHIARKKKEDLLVTLETIKALTARYSDLPSGEIQRLMANTVTTTGPER